MKVIHNWINSHKKELRNYASYRVPNDTEVMLFPRIILICVMQILASCFGITAKTAVPWWAMCILPFAATVVFVTAYFRERDSDLDGFFRYTSIYFMLVSLGLIELSMTISIHESVEYAILPTAIAFLLTFALLLHRIKREVEKNDFTQDKAQKGNIAPFAGAALGYGTHLICKQVFQFNSETALVVICIGVISGFFLVFLF